MIVPIEHFNTVLDSLERYTHLGLDTETTGLKWEHKIFSIIIYCPDNAYYFNFQYYGAESTHLNTLPRQFILGMGRLFSNTGITWIIQNAKFDYNMLAKECLYIAGKLHCTQATERVLINNLGPKAYSLDAMSQRRLGMEKDDAVEKYITRWKLWTKIPIAGKADDEKEKHYEKVPLKIIVPYGERDAELCYRIGMQQIKEVTEKGLINVYANEMELVKTCSDMQRIGITLDTNYTKLALEYESKKLEALLYKHIQLTGAPFSESPKDIAQSFTSQGIMFDRSEKNNPVLNKFALKHIEHPLPRLIEDIREAQKFIRTYYAAFLYYQHDGILHPSFNQAGAVSGRMSMSGPSLHNIPKEEHGPYQIRRCFIPRPGYLFFMLDYDQQEFRMMLDYAGEEAVIEAINRGVDVHQATADLIGITRKQAKTINFGLLYGMGKDKLANDLGIPVQEALELKFKYFSKLPKVRAFIKQVQQRGTQRGYVFNWFGRRCHLDKPENAYRLPNHIIQGGCADVSKIAMNRCHAFLKDYNSNLLLQVHDELVFEVHESEIHIVPELKKIMESVYPSRNGLPLTCSIEHSRTSWADKIKGMPYWSCV